MHVNVSRPNRQRVGKHASPLAHRPRTKVGGGQNTAVQVSQDNGPLTDVLSGGNWADAGNVTFNVANKPLASLSGITVTNNLFGRAAVTGC